MTELYQYFVDLVVSGYPAAICYFLARICVTGSIRGIRIARLAYALKRAEKIGFINPNEIN